MEDKLMEHHEIEDIDEIFQDLSEDSHSPHSQTERFK